MSEATVLELIRECFIQWNKSGADYNHRLFNKAYCSLREFNKKLADEVISVLPEEIDTETDWSGEDYSEFLVYLNQ